MDSPTAAAPAQSPTPAPQTISADLAAIGANDFGAYQDSRRAERDGKPLPPVEVKAEASAPAATSPEAPAAPAQPDKAVSKRQQQINDYERTIAELRAENARLKVPSAPAAPRSEPTPQASAPAAQSFPSVEEWAAKPENDGKSLSDYLNARDDWRDERHQEAQRLEQSRAVERQQLEERNRAFGERIAQASEEDKTFLASLPPAVLHASPLSGCVPDPQRPNIFVDPATGQPVSFLNFVAETSFLSDNPAAFHRAMKAMTPADRIALAQLPGPELMRRLSQIDGKASVSPSAPSSPAAAEPAATTPSTVSAFPAPTPTLTKPSTTADPEAAALQTNNFAAYQAIQQAKRQAARRA